MEELVQAENNEFTGVLNQTIRDMKSIGTYKDQFGFEILEEETDYREDGSVHWTIKRVRLHEVSVCTFPAYEDTGVVARKRDFADIQARKTEAWRTAMRRKMKKEDQDHGA